MRARTLPDATKRAASSSSSVRDDLAHDGGKRRQFPSYAGARRPNSPSPFGRCGRTAADIDFDFQSKWVKPWRTNPARFSQSRAERRLQQRFLRQGNSSPTVPAAAASIPPSSPFSGRFTSSTAPVCDRAPRRPRRASAAAPRSARLRRQCLRNARAPAAQTLASTDTCRRPAASACRCAAPRSISACAKSPARCFGHQRLRQRARSRGLRLRQRFFDGEQPRDHPLGIGVHRRLALVEGDRGDRRPPYRRRCRAACATPRRCRESARPIRRPPSCAARCRLRARA